MWLLSAACGLGWCLVYMGCGTCMRQSYGVVHACGKKVVWCGYDMVMGWLVVFVDGVDLFIFNCY